MKGGEKNVAFEEQTPFMRMVMVFGKMDTTLTVLEKRNFQQYCERRDRLRLVRTEMTICAELIGKASSMAAGAERDNLLNQICGSEERITDLITNLTEKK